MGKNTESKKAPYKISALNVKQKRFVEIYVSNNYNTIEDYMEVYSTKDRNTASISENKILKKKKLWYILIKKPC